MYELRRNGAGVRTGEWLVEPGALEAQVEAIVAWCQQALAGTRRPWGIDVFDLALAVGHGSGRPHSASFNRLSPAECYDEDGLACRLSAFLETALADARTPLMLAVALFSWGDAAHAALPDGAGRA